MSKRICISLLSTPTRSSISPCTRQCRSAFTTARGDHNLHPIPRHTSKTPSTRRAFSTSPQWQGVGVGRQAGKAKQKPQKSMALQQKQQMAKMAEKGEMLNYVGVLEGTFIPPTGRQLPSLISTPRDRLKIEWYRFFNVIKYFQSRFMAYWYVTPRLNLERSKTPEIAKNLYERMYQSFAAGQLERAESVLSQGLMKSLQSRINQRKQGEVLQWKLHKYLESPKCVSYVFALPDTKGINTKRTAIMQAVVRIRSQQSLLHVKRMRVKDPSTGQTVVADVTVDRDGQIIPEEKIEEEEMKSRKDMTEYFVLQRFILQGKVGDWQAWGTTQENTLADLKTKEAQRQKALLGAAR